MKTIIKALYRQLLPKCIRAQIRQSLKPFLSQDPTSTTPRIFNPTKRYFLHQTTGSSKDFALQIYALCKKYRYPWKKQSLSQRLHGLAKSKKNIIYLCDTPGPSTFRYRVYNILEAMNDNHAEAQFSFFSDSDIEHLLPYLHTVKAIVLSRVLWTFKLMTLIERAKQCGIPIIYDVDDYVFDIATTPIFIEAKNATESEQDHQYWFSYTARQFYTAQLCDACMTTNDFLKTKLEQTFKKKTYVIPNTLNQDQIQLSLTLNKQSNQKEKSKIVRLGYFSGSPSHNKDFALISEDLHALLSENKHYQLILVGYITLPEPLLKFQKKQIIQLPFQNYMQLQQLIASVDINLIPLEITDFTHCKSELKFFEAGIVKTLSIASPTFVYKHCITHGVNGYIAKEGEWYDTIKEAIHSSDRETIENNAFQYSLEHYSNRNIIQQIDNVFSDIERLRTATRNDLDTPGNQACLADNHCQTS